jgi:UDP-4-amino-4,6-dideoxy-N-acetyl-beta-L-altrosamine transaminase
MGNSKNRAITKKILPYGQQWISDEDVNEVLKTLKSDFITQGPKVSEFENKVANYVGAKYAVAVSSGTAALHAACFAAGISGGDEVITSPLTFVASSNSVLYVGGKPVFADIELDTYTIDTTEIKKNITSKTKAIIPVDFAGHPCELDKIMRIAKKNNLCVIEDAAHALGARYNGKIIGSIADMTILSFHPVKHITTGEGGMVMTNNEKFYQKLLLFRTHGITKDSNKFVNKDLAFAPNPKTKKVEVNPWYYEMQELGYNYRMTDFQCALGIAQLEKLDRFIERRRWIVSRYNAAFKKLKNVIVPIEKDGVKSSYHLYVVRIYFKNIGKSRAQVMNELKESGVGSQVHYIPVHLQPYYRSRFGYVDSDFPNTMIFYQQALSLPLYPKMTDNDVENVINAVTNLVG